MPDNATPPDNSTELEDERENDEAEADTPAPAPEGGTSHDSAVPANEDPATPEPATPVSAVREKNTAEWMTRYGIGVLGLVAGLWGLWLLWVESQYIDKVNFVAWLAGGLIVSDVIIANVLLAAGWLLTKVLPPHLRGYVQGALVVIALVGSAAFFMILRQGTFEGAPSKALLQQNYVANFGIIAFAVVVCAAVLYAISLVSMRKSRPE